MKTCLVREKSNHHLNRMKSQLDSEIENSQIHQNNHRLKKNCQSFSTLTSFVISGIDFLFEKMETSNQT